VGNGDLLGIGAFALASGLSIHALRHYDEVGLVRPASVDPVTGFRRYLPREVLEDPDGEVAPAHKAGKPRSSRVVDPSGNRIDLYQG
jgi:hypothetical protein